MSGKRVLVTGGSGYIGSRVVRALVERGHTLIVVDRAEPKNSKNSFPQEVEFRKCDLRIPAEALQAVRGADVVLHLAADIGSMTYMRDHKAEILTNNAAIDAAVYPALVANKIPWIVYSSSSMVFQHPPQFPYTEADITKIRPPSNVYGFAKLIGEYFCRAYHDQYGISYTIIRYHNVYGPGEDSKGASPGDIHVIPALIEKVQSGQYPLQFHGDPPDKATRPFVFIDDAVEATVGIVERALAGEKTVKNEDFNIGSDTYYTILELGKMIWNICGDGRDFAYSVQETESETALRREVDITKIKTTLGWAPRTSLEDGLKATIEWMTHRNVSKE